MAIAALLLAEPAQAEPASVKVGVLTCNVASGWGFVFGSSRNLNCTYSGGPGPVEQYSGAISKFGVDIGYVEGGVIVWGVFAPTSTLAPGALAGEYVGGTASVSVGVGLGANALLGGFDKSIALQPLSFEGNNGLNVAAGIGAISLTSHR
ncbi:MAG: DUF992 domain-containing protein [Acidobacteriota bacterium]